MTLPIGFAFISLKISRVVPEAEIIIRGWSSIPSEPVEASCKICSIGVKPRLDYVLVKRILNKERTIFMR